MKQSTQSHKPTSNQIGLNPIYQDKNESILICPMTGEKFGRPLVLYPSDPADIKRAEAYQPSKSKKKRKNSEKQDQNSISEKVSKTE